MSNMSERDVALLKEALFKQYVIMKKLFAELDEERDASASAASEALSMILRLQREKAAEKMEASQYRRMAEEKISHAEECMMILEEVIQQKEFEISVLKDHLQKYKKKLLSIGLNDIGFENYLPESASTSSKNNLVSGNTGIQSSFRRIASLPSLKFGKLLTEMDSSNEDSSLLLKECKKKKNIPRSFDCSDSNEVTELVKYELSSGSSVNQAMGSNCQSLMELSMSSWHSALSNDISFKSAAGDSKILDKESALNIAPECYEKISNSSSVLDIVEVPKDGGSCTLSKPYKLCSEESTNKPKRIIGVEDLMPQGREFIDSNAWSNDALAYTCSRSNTSPSKKKSFARQALKLSVPIKDRPQDYTFNCEDIVPTPRDDLEQIKSRLQQIEGEKTMKMKDTESGSERLRLLKEIYEQINMIENRLNASPSKKQATQEDASIVSITEAILSFAI